MLLADQQREGDVVVVVERGRGTAEAGGGVAAAFDSRMGFHAPHTADLDGRTVEGPGANQDADVRDQLPVRRRHEHAVVGRRPLDVPAGAGGNNVRWVDRRRERLQREALVVDELRNRLHVNPHVHDAVPQRQCLAPTGERRAMAIARSTERPWPRRSPA